MIGRTNSTFGGGAAPDGATVAPINDISILLKCAGINGKNYTTMAQLLNDSDAIEDVTMSENAMKYLARSTDFANEVCANETFMTFLGSSSYVNDTVLNSDIWVTSVCDSSYFESVLNIKVPTMTSNISPSGEAFGDDYYEDRVNFYHAFDGTTDSGCHTTYYNQIRIWHIGYKFQIPIIVRKCAIIVSTAQTIATTITIKVQCSDDGSNWEDVSNTLEKYFPKENDIYMVNFELYINTSNQYHKYYRLETNGIGVTIRMLQFYGRC